MNRLIFISGIICCFTLISGQINKPEQEAKCFKFTWLGPGYNNNSTVDFSCPKSQKIPCINPCVVTTNSQAPNTTWMWENKNLTDEITCPLVTGACMKYSYIYDNTILNTTYFCGKMTEDRTNPVTTGCYTQTVNGHTIEACACKSVKGMPPCNSSLSTYLPSSTFVFLIMILTIYQAL